VDPPPVPFPVVPPPVNLEPPFPLAPPNPLPFPIDPLPAPPPTPPIIPNVHLPPVQGFNVGIPTVNLFKRSEDKEDEEGLANSAEKAKNSQGEERLGHISDMMDKL
jgi:hypothetical protein